MAEQRADKKKTVFYQTNEELAVQAQAGDKAAISQLWNQTRGIIFMILARYYNRNPDQFARCGVTMDDLEQEGFFAVLEAVEAFNPAKGEIYYLAQLPAPEPCKRHFRHQERTGKAYPLE